MHLIRYISRKYPVTVTNHTWRSSPRRNPQSIETTYPVISKHKDNIHLDIIRKEDVMEEMKEPTIHLIKAHRNKNLKETAQIWKDFSWTDMTTSKTIIILQQLSRFMSIWVQSKIKADISGQPLKTRSNTLFQGQQIQSKPQLKQQMTLTPWCSIWK